MANHPKISVCIPTYNGRQFLAECINSIRAQTFDDFEVLVCDDESSDGTLELARKLAAGDKRFQFVANARRFGLVGNWNNCVKRAGGEWIKFVFQDDVIFPSCLEKLLAVCQRSQRPFGFCERDFIFDQNVSEIMRGWFARHKERVRFNFQGREDIEARHAVQLFAQASSQNLVGEPTVTLIRRSLFHELGGFNEALVQLCDAEFWCRAMIHHGGVFVGESLAAFRVHAGATTAQNHKQRAFRMDILDPLVLRCQFAFGRHYKPLRSPQLTGKSIPMLRRECAADAANVWRQAKIAGRGEDNSKMGEWQSVCAHYPGFMSIARLGCGIDMLGRLKRKIVRVFHPGVQRAKSG